MTTSTHLNIKQPAKSAITREYILIKLEGSYERFLPEKILSSARKNFACRSIVIAEKKGEKEGQKSIDYLIGLHTRDASKNTYKQKSRKIFTEIGNFTLLDASARKGIGGWARALCSNELSILSCSGELDKKELHRIALQSERKKYFLSITKKNPKKEKGCKKSLVPLPDSNRKTKALLLMVLKMLKALLLMVLKMLKTLLLMVLKSIINKLIMTAVSRIIILVMGYAFFIYVFQYKGGAQLTPEMIQQQTLGDIIDWLTDWNTPGLPEKFTKVKRPVLSILKDSLISIVSAVTYVSSFLFNVKRLFTETKKFIAWVSKFFQ